MERKIGETFEYKGKTFKVKEDENGSCHGCFFDGHCYDCRKHIAGNCSASGRSDNIDVIFVEVKDEQPQELNLCEVLKYRPEGETFWSPLLGDVKFHDINQKRNFIVISLESGETWDINADGTITFGDVTSPEIMLYPSREQRDWAKVKYEPRKERFDPKTLKAFDKVLVRDIGSEYWYCGFFSHIVVFDDVYRSNIGGVLYVMCIPYNDDTKHLVGTKEEAPEYYRYWED